MTDSSSLKEATSPRFDPESFDAAALLLVPQAQATDIPALGPGLVTSPSLANVIGSKSTARWLFGLDLWVCGSWPAVSGFLPVFFFFVWPFGEFDTGLGLRFVGLGDPFGLDSARTFDEVTDKHLGDGLHCFADIGWDGLRHGRIHNLQGVES